MKKENVIKHLCETNESKYQILKACEELSELNTVLLQYVNKKGRKTSKKDITDEIGDVKIRLKILQKIFGKKEVKKRYNFKLKKFAKYIKQELYTGGI